MKTSRSTPTGLKIIIDSNIFIALENLGVSNDAHSQLAAEFQRLVVQLGATIVVSAGTRSDLLNASDQTRSKRSEQLKKYYVLQPVPLESDLAGRAGFPAERSANDDADLEVLSALAASAADWLVTQDSNLRKRSNRAGYGDRVFSLPEILGVLTAYVNKPTGLPAVYTMPAYQLDLSAPIFASIREDYAEFNDWWREKVAREHRDVLVLGSAHLPEGVAVLKIELDSPHDLPHRVLKVCTFKTAEEFRGSRRGELLLKAVIDYARRNACSHIYMEVLPVNGILLSWLADFGFKVASGAKTIRGERVAVKSLQPNASALGLDPLIYNVTFGPGAIKADCVHFIPIRAGWHRRLFPEAEQQSTLFPQQDPCGNAIRKAYLCHAVSRHIEAGDALCFLKTREGGGSTANAVGVAEDTISSLIPEEIIRFVGNRTVYSADEIRQMCAEGEVLAVQFRFDRVLVPPWTKHQLQSIGAIKGDVQSIQRARQEGVEWIRQHLAG